MILTISGKVSDMFAFTIDRNGREMMAYDGYVPRALGVGSGDYISISIDAETGQILDWKPINMIKLVEECSELAGN